MLMEVLLLKDLFSRKGDAPFSIDASKTLAASRGCGTWSRSGAWVEESGTNKLRLKLGQDPKLFVALQDSEEKGVLSRLKDHVTHVNVSVCDAGDNRNCVSVNLASLCKRIHLSLAVIIFMRLCGRLTLGFIELRAQEALGRNEVFDRIIANGRASALVKGENPDEKVRGLREILKTVLNSRRLAHGILIQQEKSMYVAYGTTGKQFSLTEKGKVLGEGSYGIVYEMLNLCTGEMQAAKFAKKQDRKAGIGNESLILGKVHAEGNVEGIQEAPYSVVDLYHRQFGMGYFTKKYEYTLEDSLFLKGVPVEDRLSGVHSLYSGLADLHRMGIVHGDIKPANCCSSGGKLNLADFGHARELAEISPDQPLGVCTPYFTSQADQRENTRIALDYCLHLIAVGKVRNPLAKAWVLQTAIEHPGYPIDKAAAKFSIAEILMNLRKDRIKALNIAEDLFKNEMEILRKKPQRVKIPRLNLRSFRLTEAQLRKLDVESINLCKRHDVFGLGLTVLSALLGVRYIRPAQLEASIQKLQKIPELKMFNPELTGLLRGMMNQNPANRPTSADALRRYEALIAKKAGSQATAS